MNTKALRQSEKAFMSSRSNFNSSQRKKNPRIVSCNIHCALLTDDLMKACAFNRRSMHEGVRVIPGKTEWKCICRTGGRLESTGQSCLGSFKDTDILTAVFCQSHWALRLWLCSREFPSSRWEHFLCHSRLWMYHSFGETAIHVCRSQYHRSTEWFELEGTLKTTWLWSPCPGLGHLPLRPGCSEPHTSQPQILPEVENPQLSWATCATSSPPSQ